MNNLLCVMQLWNDYNIAVPLSLKGATAYFNTRKPTLHEYEKDEKEGRSYDLTYDSPDLNPHQRAIIPKR